MHITHGKCHEHRTTSCLKASYISQDHRYRWSSRNGCFHCSNLLASFPRISDTCERFCERRTHFPDVRPKPQWHLLILKSTMFLCLSSSAREIRLEAQVWQEMRNVTTTHECLCMTKSEGYRITLKTTTTLTEQPSNLSVFGLPDNAPVTVFNWALSGPAFRIRRRFCVNSGSVECRI